MAKHDSTEYDDSCTEIDGPHIAQKRWLDSIETIPFDPSMRLSDSQILGEGTPPRAVPPVRVDAIRSEPTPRQVRRAQGTPRPQTHGTPRPQQRPPRAPARHPHDNVPTRLNHVDVAGGHVSYSPDPDVYPTPMPLPPSPTARPLHAPYGAPALPPHAPTAMAVPPQAIMPTQIAQPMPAQMPTQVAQQLPALVRPYEDGVTPYPVPPWATGEHRVAPAVQQSAVQQRGYAPQNHLDIYSDTDERSASTMRVAALPPMQTPSLRPPIARYLLPMIGGTALVVFVAGYFLVRGDASTKAAPVASAAVMPAREAPIVTELPPEPQLPAPSWKERAAQPTIVAKAEPAPPAPVVEPIEEAAAEPVAEIEMAPMPTKKKSSSSSARRPKRVAAIELPKAKAKPVAKTEVAKVAKKSIAKSKSERDPILEEIEKPSKSSQPKATGPGKLVVSSSVPTLIYVDGRSTNLMTPKTLNLAAGTHKITLLELKSRKAKTVDIDIASGSIAKLDKKF